MHLPSPLQDVHMHCLHTLDSIALPASSLSIQRNLTLPPMHAGETSRALLATACMRAGLTQTSEREPESGSLGGGRMPSYTQAAKAEPLTPRHRTPRTPDTGLASPMPSTGRFSTNTGNNTARTIFETAASSVFNTAGESSLHPLAVQHFK